jgi:hypothetical protein
MRFTRNLVIAVMSAAAVSLSVGLPTALAAAPGNDAIGGATTAGLGFSQDLDTSEATTDAVDADANTFCGAPATDASVWYAYTAAADGGAIVDVSSSDYSAGVIVVSGSPGAFRLETCGPGTVGFSATAGTTYYVLAFDDQVDGAGNGGMLRISLNAAPPPPTIDVKVDKTGYVSKTGTATISGTISCTDATFAGLSTLLQQQQQKATVNGFGGFFADGSICTGTPQPWTSEVLPESGAFQSGKSASFTSSFACGVFACATGYTFQDIKLKAAKK